MEDSRLIWMALLIGLREAGAAGLPDGGGILSLVQRLDVVDTKESCHGTLRWIGRRSGGNEPLHRR